MTTTQDQSLLGGVGDWRNKLDLIVDTMREISKQTDPQKMVQLYGKRMGQLLPRDRLVSLSRRDLPAPQYRITRSDLWKTQPNPWKAKEGLPVFESGLLGELLYADQPQLIDELDVSRGDPAYEYFDGMKSLVAIPLFDQGIALNMVVLMSRQERAFKRENLPEHVWMSNLFGRATHALVMADEVRTAYQAVDREMKIVADIQRSLLPTGLPDIPTLKLAAHYQTSKNAGGDYYDFFPLPDGKWGILIADVSGHGTPAAVFMAVTHSIAHTHNGPPTPPGYLLGFVNQHLVERYTNGNGTFVTAFYGIYDPKTRSLTYASAGHPPPRLKRGDRTVCGLDGARGLPLGIDPEERYEETTVSFSPGDLVLFYTDGITEAHRPGVGELFGTHRLDDSIRDCAGDPELHIDLILLAVDDFTENAPATDDRTILAAQVT